MDLQARRFDVLNLSIAVPDTLASAAMMKSIGRYLDAGGLVVVAAGNAGLDLDKDEDGLPVNRGALTIALSRVERGRQVLVVAGTMRDPESGETVLLDESNWSSGLVDIAAPATGVLSYGLDGELACAPGTSVAAPQVTFVAGMLISFGLWSAEEVERRILATADIAPALWGWVRDGRSLNVANALDLYVDLIWLRDPKQSTGMAAAPLRALILDREGGQGGNRVGLCAVGSKDLDLQLLLMWERFRDAGSEADMATIWMMKEGDVFEATECRVGSDHLLIRDMSTGETKTVELSDIARIVPSRFRLAMATQAVAAQDWPDTLDPNLKRDN